MEPIGCMQNVWYSRKEPMTNNFMHASKYNSHCTMYVHIIFQAQSNVCHWNLVMVFITHSNTAIDAHNSTVLSLISGGNYCNI